MWILIITLWVPNGAATSTAEFNTESSCNKAGDEWIKQNDSFSKTVRFICVSKG